MTFTLVIAFVTGTVFGCFLATNGDEVPVTHLVPRALGRVVLAALGTSMVFACGTVVFGGSVIALGVVGLL